MSGGDHYSFSTYDEVVGRIAHHLQPTTILDIGAGSGKYGRLIRAVLPNATITALEMDAECIEVHGLGQIYDEILEITGSELITNHPLRNFDLVILGDVIEHMRKSGGVDLLDFLTYRTQYTLIITPEAMMMNKAPWYLGHNSTWTSRDFVWHTNWADTYSNQMQLFLLRGYIIAELPLSQIVGRLNAEQMQVTYEGVTETCILEHHEHVRTRLRPLNENSSLIDWWRAY